MKKGEGGKRGSNKGQNERGETGGMLLCQCVTHARFRADDQFFGRSVIGGGKGGVKV